MKRAILYLVSLIWNITVCWPAVLIIRLAWGSDLRWESFGGTPSLWTDLKPDSWPTRSWYRLKDNDGSPAPTTEDQRAAGMGKWQTWAGTTLGHGGFYGPGWADSENPTHVQRHEHVHVEQFEVSMLRSFAEGAIFGVAGALASGNASFGVGAFLVLWWLGYIFWGVPGFIVAFLRGEPAYMGSVHEESAYAQTED